MSVRIAVLGCGYWGPNLVRVFSTLPGVELYALCDLDTRLAGRLADQYARNARIVTDYQALVDDPLCDGVVIATPMSTHYRIAGAFLAAGKHVMVEKPLATTAQECAGL